MLAFLLSLSSCHSVLQPYPGPALWQLDHEGKRLWLFGTIHRLPEYSLEERVVARRGATRIKRIPPMPWRTIPVRQAVGDADELYIEMLPLADHDLVNVIYKLSNNTEEQPPLNAFLDDQQKASVTAAAIKRGITPALLEDANPLLVFSLFANTQAAHEGVPAFGADYWLARDAQSQHMEIKGLETIHDRMRALSSAIESLHSAEQTRVFLRYLETELGDVSVNDPDYQELIRLWIHGDIATLGQRLSVYAHHLPKIHEAFITARNKTWLGVIEQDLLANDQEEFIAVGIGHLVGPDNLVQLLMQKGYNIQRLQ